MSEQFVLQFKSFDDVELYWCHTLDGEIQQSGVGDDENLRLMLSKYAAAEKVVLIPAQDCLVTQVVIPSNQRRQQLKAIPFMLEESLAEDIEQMHFALGKRDSNGSVPVCAIAKESLSKYQQRLESIGIQANMIVATSSLLECPEGAWSLFNAGDVYIVNQNGTCWSGTEQEVSVMLQLSVDALEQEQYPNLLYWAVDKSGQGDIPNWVTALGLDTSLQSIRDSQQALISRINDQRINLLQGEFEVQDDWYMGWKVWRRVAIIAGVAVILKVLLMAINIGLEKNEQQYLKAEIAKAYHEVAPGARIVDVKRQMMQLLSSAGAGGNSQSFLVLLNSVAEGIAKIPKIVPTNIIYDGRKSEIRLDLLVSKLPDLDRLKDFLSKQGLIIEVGGASAQGNQYSGRLIIRGSR